MKLSEVIPDSDLIRCISPGIAQRWRFFPLQRLGDGSIVIATPQPDNVELIDNLTLLLGSRVSTVPCSEEELQHAFLKHFGLGADAIESLGVNSENEEPLESDAQPEETAMMRFVNDLLKQAHLDRATDIHIEPFEKETLIRFRVDGLLNPIRVPEALVRHQGLLTSRIKVMARMNIAEKRLPQDGRIRVNINHEDVDVRVSTIPTIHGETVDLRLLPQRRMMQGIENLGLSDDHMKKLRALIRKPNGILLVTGPTGHGKTTSLYSFLSSINTPEKKIVTIEDPVEYRLHGINQIQVHSKIGLTFAAGLRSVLRQDPDVMMVGEIRDTDTAEIAIRAALTGHLVFSTLHTNDSTGAVTRLIDMGIEPYLVASSISAVLAQRLVRTLCSGCSGTGQSCVQCRNTGYHGRTGIFELLVIDDVLRDLILQRVPAATLRKKAVVSGMQTMFQHGEKKVEEKLTTQNEVLRVVEAMA